MPSLKHQVLDCLRRDDLLAALDAFDLEVQDRLVRQQSIDALARSRRASMPEILGLLRRLATVRGRSTTADLSLTAQAALA